MSMRILLGPLLVALLVLTGCGSESGGPGAGRGSESAGGLPATTAATSALPADGPIDHEVVALVSGSAAGPTQVDSQVAALPDAEAVRDFASGFRGALDGEVVRAAGQADVPSGQTLVGAVVAVGCEPPTRVHVRMAGGELSVTADPVLSRRRCFVAVTTVALVTVPSEAAPQA